jgi:RTX calcium-binding nonapeptide repeat (4 copies)
MFKKLFACRSDRPAPKSRKPAPCRVQLAVENLERRDVPFVAPYLAADHVIYMQTTDLGDKVTVSVVDPDGKENTYNDVVKIKWERGDGTSNTYSIPYYSSAPNAYPPVVGVKKLSIQGGAGNDTITIGANTNIPAVIRGAQGNDQLTGGKANDTIEGGSGSDVIWGGRGNDRLYGCREDVDVPDTALAANVLHGGPGNDRLYGGLKALFNTLYGDEGHDLLMGGNDAQNYMYGNDGNDYLGGGSRSPSGPFTLNVMVGGLGEDVLQGGNYAFNYMYAKEGSTAYLDIVSIGKGGYNAWNIDTAGTFGETDWDSVDQSGFYFSPDDYYLKWGFPPP